MTHARLVRVGACDPTPTSREFKSHPPTIPTILLMYANVRMLAC